MRAAGLKRSKGGGARIGCALDIDFRKVDVPDGQSFMSRDVYGHLCTVHGAVWYADGAYCDGSDDYIEANACITSSDPGGKQTIEASGKLADWGSNRDIIALSKAGASGPYNGLDYMSATNLLGAATFETNENRVSSQQSHDGDTMLRHLASVVNASSHIISFFVDGVNQGSDSTYVNDLSTMDACYIGQLAWGAPNINPWKGVIRQARVYSYAEYAAKILQRAIRSRTN